MPIHRTIKNVVKNYTHAEVKVREATSNDPWGPPSMVMAEIAQMSHDLLAFSEIMPMIWKRLNDHGKNWRHVYKSLILLDYLVKAGSERVVQYCMENIVSIQTLKDFQHFEDGVDHGLNIREKAKQLVTLLKDTDKLRNERSRATNVKNRFGISTGYALTDSELRSASPPAVSNFSSSAERRYIPSYTSESSPAAPVHASSRPPAADSEMESVRPSTTNEEDLQLQLALAMSKEEHDEEIKKRKGDEIKLQMAIEESRKTAQQEHTRRRQMTSIVAAAPPQPRHQTVQSQPWDWEPGNAMADSWSAPLEPKKDPWSSGGGARTQDPRAFDHSSSPVVYAEIQKNLKPQPAPWEEVAAKYSAVEANFANPCVPHDDFVQLRAQPVGAEKKQNIEKWLDSNLTAEDSDDNLWDINEIDGSDKKAKSAKKVTPEEFLGPNAKLVDFDDLVSKPVTTSAVNPFAMTINKSTTVNPFVAKAQEEERSRKVPLNQLQSSASSSSSFIQASSSLVPASGLTVTGFPPPTLAVVYPSQPIMQQQGYNPFL